MSRLLLNTKIEEATINGLVKAASYAVRGKIVTRSAQLAERLKQGEKLPFKKLLLVILVTLMH